MYTSLENNCQFIFRINEKTFYHHFYFALTINFLYSIVQMIKKYLGDF